MKFNTQKKTLVVVAMVCIALILGTYGSNFSFSGLFGGSVPMGGVDPSTSPSPTYSGGWDDETYDETYTPTPEPETEPEEDEPTITPTGQQDYLWLDMNPNPATQRDVVLGEIWSNFYSGVQVTVHYIDGIEYSQLVTLNGSGYGSFEVQFKTGSFLFWVTYSTLTSNYVTLVVSP
jgi:hypothetical protein